MRVLQLMQDAPGWMTDAAGVFGLLVGVLALGCASPAGPGDGEPEAADTAELRRLRAAAERGDAELQTYLGTLYSRGEGVAADDSQAVGWYRKAAEQGYPTGQFNLGIMYAAGRGVPEDHAEASAWFLRAAEQGLAQAQYNLAASYYTGRGVPWDLHAAHSWFSRAAEGLEGDAQTRASEYRDQAWQLLQLIDGAEAGRSDAQLTLGKLYAAGKGLPRDQVAAYKWLSLAAASGGEGTRSDATGVMTTLEAEMSREQVAEAQRAATEWSRARSASD